MQPKRPAIDQELIVQRSRHELADLYAELQTAVEGVYNHTQDWTTVYPILAKVRHLEADARMAGSILGMLSPWIPRVADLPAGTPEDVADRRNLSIRTLADLLPGEQLPGDDRYRWPQLEDAIRWIEESGIASKEELAKVQRDLHNQVFVDGALEDQKSIGRLRAAIAESIEKGESFRTFRKKIEHTIDLTKNQLETVFRTNTKRAFLAGQDRTLEQPRVAQRFRWFYYASTADNRVRPWHFFFDGWVAERESQLGYLMRQVQGEYSCRCALIPVDEPTMKEYGGAKTMADVPESILLQIRLDAYQGDRKV